MYSGTDFFPPSAFKMGITKYFLNIGIRNLKNGEIYKGELTGSELQGACKIRLVRSDVPRARYDSIVKSFARNMGSKFGVCQEIPFSLGLNLISVWENIQIKALCERIHSPSIFFSFILEWRTFRF